MIPSQMFALGDGGSDYDIPYSLRLRSAGSGYLFRTPAVVGTPTKWTWSGWVKRSFVGTGNLSLICGRLDDNNRTTFYFGNDALIFSNIVASVPVASVSTPALFRDPSSHYHVQINYDSANAIQGDRIRIYVNGLRLAVTGTLPGLNDTSFISKANMQSIGRIEYSTPQGYFDGYLSEVIFVDGQVLGPEWFGKYSKDTGQWVPVQYIGSYGTNGYYLDFKDVTSLITLCYDKSGQSNHWTSSNVSLSASRTYDSMIDTPTNNFPVINPLNLFNANVASTVSEGNLFHASQGGGNAYSARSSTFALTSGKWYFETTVVLSQTTVNFNGAIGITAVNTSALMPASYVCINHSPSTSKLAKNGVDFQTGLAGLVSGDVIAVAFDLDNLTCTFYKNGTQIGNVVTGLTAGQYQALFVAVTSEGGFGTNFAANFGQRPFAYAPPSGFSKICAKNLPTPSVKRGETGFDIATYTGNGGNLQVGEYQYPRSSYLINRSVRFKGVNSSLTKTFGAPGNRKTWTWSGWVKRSAISAYHTLFGATAGNPTGGVDYGVFIRITGNTDALQIIDYQNTAFNFQVTAGQLSKETSDWVHVLVKFDTTQAVAANRTLIFINGIAAYISSFIYPTLNADYLVNSTMQHLIGAATIDSVTSEFLQGYLAEVNFIDGQSLGPENFGEFDANGYWIPKAYAGTYGNNGFRLDFEDISSAAALGYDKSGRGNNWSVNNITLVAGVNYDSMIDTPTNNFAVLNLGRVLASPPNNPSITNGTLTYSTPDTGQRNAYSSLKLKPGGKYYYELHNDVDSGPGGTIIGIFNVDLNVYVIYQSNGIIQGCNPNTAASSFTTNDTVACAVDLVNNTIEFFKNGVSQGGSRSISSNIYDAYFSVSGIAGARSSVNFGQRPFTYTPPVGFNTLSIPNIAEYTYGLESPDLVWIKCRNAAQNHMLFDNVRGGGVYQSSNLQDINVLDVNSLISFNKNGFYLGNNANVNTLNNTYAAWMWKCNGTPYTNNDGNIASYVKADPAKGFSIVQWTGTGTNINVGHGLGLLPQLIIIKNETGLQDWAVFHRSYWNITNGLLKLNLTGVAYNNFGVYGHSGTSQVFGVNTDAMVNAVGQRYIAYCFAEIDGFSKFGSYTGNGNADGPFVYCGFKPRFLLVKNTGGATSWLVTDTQREPNNGQGALLQLNDAGVESAGSGPIPYVDVTSNGFKIRSTNPSYNSNGTTMIFAAFAECPFKYSNAH